jgi:F0F1-type ATP synthase assembly protein I
MSDERIPEERAEDDEDWRDAETPDAEERFRRAMEAADKELDAARREADARIGERIERLEALAGRLGEAKPQGAEPEFEERLARIEAKAEAVRAAREGKSAAESKRRGSDAEDYRGLGIGLAVAYTIIGVPIAGAAIGWLLDQAMGSALWIQVCTLAGATLGVFMAVLMLNKANQSR